MIETFVVTQVFPKNEERRAAWGDERVNLPKASQRSSFTKVSERVMLFNSFNLKINMCLLFVKVIKIVLLD